MKVDFVLELGYEDFRGDFVLLAEAPLYYSGLKLADGSMYKLFGHIVSLKREFVVDTLNALVEENANLNQAWLSYQGFNIAVFNYENGNWILSA